jgi:hypothetical protein
MPVSDYDDMVERCAEKHYSKDGFGIVNLDGRGMLVVSVGGGSGRKVLCWPIVLPALTERGRKKAPWVR